MFLHLSCKKKPITTKQPLALLNSICDVLSSCQHECSCFDLPFMKTCLRNIPNSVHRNESLSVTKSNFFSHSNEIAGMSLYTCIAVASFDESYFGLLPYDSELFHNSLSSSLSSNSYLSLYLKFLFVEICIPGSGSQLSPNLSLSLVIPSLLCLFLIHQPT